MNKAQIGFHLVVIINSYADKPIEKAGRRTLPHRVPNPARELSWALLGGGRSGGGEVGRKRAARRVLSCMRGALSGPFQVSA